jgi:hypothetical protein
MNDFTQELMQQLQRYGKLLDEQVQEEAKKASQELVAELKQSSPKRKGKGGKYAKGWRLKKQGNSYIVHNATDYQLTHLLEKGHALRNGGRTRAFPHIRPAENKAVQSFLAALERVIEE